MPCDMHIIKHYLYESECCGLLVEVRLGEVEVRFGEDPEVRLGDSEERSRDDSRLPIRSCDDSRLFSIERTDEFEVRSRDDSLLDSFCGDSLLGVRLHFLEPICFSESVVVNQ